MLSRILLFSIVLILILCQRVFSEQERFSVVQPERNALIVEKDGKPLHRIDISEKVGKHERARLSLTWPKLRTLSPDGKTMPLYVEGGNTSAALLLVDVEKGTAKRQEIARPHAYFIPEEIRWITSHSLLLSAPLSYGEHVFHDIDKGKTTILREEAFPAWDAQGENFASIFNKNSWFGGRNPEFRGTIGGNRLLVSEVLRYNGYCVYPVPVKGYRTYQEYEAWGNAANSEDLRAASPQPPRLVKGGVILPESHNNLSRPTFVGQTSWVGFFETVFPIDNCTSITHINVVLIDAHEVNTDPPKQKDIALRNKAIASGLETITAEQYLDLVMNLEARWNGETNCLELWKRVGWKENILPAQKFGEISVDPKTMQLGEYRQTLPIKDINWTVFVSAEPAV